MQTPIDGRVDNINGAIWSTIEPIAVVTVTDKCGQRGTLARSNKWPIRAAGTCSVLPIGRSTMRVASIFFTGMWGVSTPSRVILDQYKWELAERSQFNYSVYVMDKKTSHDRFKVLKWNFPLWYNEIHSARTRVWCSWASANIFSRKNMHDFLIKERKMQKKRTKRDWVQHFSATITNDQCTCWRRAVTTRLTFSHLRPAFKVHFSFCLLFCARFQLWRSTRECNEHLHESAHANFSGRPTCFRL